MPQPPPPPPKKRSFVLPPSLPTTANTKTTTTASNSSSRGGEIVEVQGGHIVRSTGRKDRHSKVCTAKGPRDRRVRLSAHTAIQFYDVQDRLGYDRPSKAVDWLIKKAKAAIDQLAELPAWNPTSTCSTSAPQKQQQQQHTNEIPVGHPVIASSSGRKMLPEQQFSSHHDYNRNNNSSREHNYSTASGFLPGSLDTGIADTIKSFFPVETATASFHSYLQPSPSSSKTASGGNQQDLRLSLQSFQDPILLHHDHQQQVLFAGTNALGFDGTGWSEQHHQDEHDHGRFHRMVTWNANAAGNSGHGAGFAFTAPPPPASVFGGHGQYFTTQRGPLQSSNTPSIRAWIDPSMVAAAAVADHQYHHHYLSPSIHQASVSPSGFSGFRIPARIQGEEEHGGVSDKPSSASSDSRH